MVHSLLVTLVPTILGVLLLTQCHLSVGNDIYYVTPSASSPGSCPGEPCHTIDYYATYDFEAEPPTTGSCVSLYFLNGVHTLTKVMNISNLHCFKMISRENSQASTDDKVIVHFACGVEYCQTILNVTEVTIELMGIQGTGKLLLNGIGRTTIHRVNFTDSGNNAHSTEALGSSGLTISSYSAPVEVTMTNCLLQANVDPNHIVFFYNANVSLENCYVLDNRGTAIYAYESRIAMSGTVSFVNNTGSFGGALHLTSSFISLTENTTVNFIDNRATSTGGAIFINDPLFFLANVHSTSKRCFYELPWNGTGIPASLVFANNTAQEGGYHIYGTSAKSYCVAIEKPQQVSKDVFDEVFAFSPSLNSSWSGVTSVPTRVCLCDSSGHPQCNHLSMIIVNNITVSPGENFSLSVVLAGANFGTSLGEVFAFFADDSSAEFEQLNQKVQQVHSLESCAQVYYSIKSNRDNVVVHLSSKSQEERYEQEETLKQSIQVYEDTKVPPLNLQMTSITLNVKLLPCPTGFDYEGEPPFVTCACYKSLTNLGVSCNIKNGTGSFSHSNSVWFSKLDDGNRTGTSRKVIVNRFCPIRYCNVNNVTFDLESGADTQCAFNRAGVLCGGCKDGYSLAIGSSHCINCPNNNNLALLVFFAVAGLLIVLLTSALNLTISVGLMNGIIFYANVVWTYNTILFPPEYDQKGIQFLKTFIAWINLDFGIETCFFQGLTAYTKTWLQFLFPFYLWFISGAIVVCCHYSTRMTKMFGNRAVPVLATLICLSYVKLMRIIIDGLAMSTLRVYPNGTKSFVWSLDGNLRYGQFPHIFLLLASLAALIILWIPYTIALTFMQWFRRFSNMRICHWTVIYKPFYDCQFSCLKDKHHYWHGALLLARGIHVVIFTLTATISPNVNLFLLHIVAMLFLIYEVYMEIYKSRAVQLLHGSLLLNLAILGGSVVYAELIGGQKIIPVVLSISIVFVQFWGLVLWNAVDAARPFLKRVWNRYHGRYTTFEHESEAKTEERESISSSSVKVSDFFTRFRDSILEDSRSLQNPI